MGLYVAFDLHSNNGQLGIVNEKGKKIYRKKLPNESAAILRELEPYRMEIMGIAVEYTYNW
jgi:transposase